MGRPLKLDDVTAQRIVAAVAKGLPRDTAAKLAAIAPRTLYGWLARGRDGEEPYSQFLHRVKRAEAESEEEMVSRVREASKASWQAAAWWLERRRPERWALRKVEPRDTKTNDGIDSMDPRERVQFLESVLSAARSAPNAG
jgi:transposase